MGEEPDRVAMRSDLRVLKSDLETRIGGVETRMGSLENRLIKKIDASADETRRYFDVVAEKMRDDFTMVVDKTVALDEKVDRLITRNAAEHAAFVEAIADHDVRLRVLEKIHDRAKPAN